MHILALGAALRSAFFDLKDLNPGDDFAQKIVSCAEVRLSQSFQQSMIDTEFATSTQECVKFPCPLGHPVVQ